MENMMEIQSNFLLSHFNIETENDLENILKSPDNSEDIKRGLVVSFNYKNNKSSSMDNTDGGNYDDDDEDYDVDYRSKHEQNQYDILKKYFILQWDSPKNSNECLKTIEEPYIAELNATQRFLIEYFQPSLSLKGMLLWHSVGSGKTCTLVSIASGHFEEENYRIMYICRKSLLNSFYKNVFDTVCHHRVRNMTKLKLAKEMDKSSQKKKSKKKEESTFDAPTPEIKRKGSPLKKKNKKDIDDGLWGGNHNVYTTIPAPKSTSNSDIQEEVLTKQIEILNNSLWTKPLTYRQLGNLCQRINYKSLGTTDIDKNIRDDYRHITDAEGKEATKRDPLYKTLIIIDEAHYLFKEDPEDKQIIDREAIREALMRSYDISGPNSAKVLLLSATPMYNHPKEFIELMNLLRPREQQINILDQDLIEMIKEDIKEDNNDGDHTQMLNFIGKHFSGYVSYLNRSEDPSQFAQVHIDYIDTPMTKDQESKIKKSIFGIKENEIPINNPNPKLSTQKVSLTQMIRDALSEEDYYLFYNVFTKFHKGEASRDLYINECRRLLYNYPEILEILLINV